MADFYAIAPELGKVLERWEGGLSADRDDKALEDPINLAAYRRIGYHTNKGVTYASYLTSVRALGRMPNDGEFLAMPKALWLTIMKFFYWDAVRADEIKHTAVAIMLFDYAWGSGPKEAGIAIQRVLNAYFKKGLVVDGAIGYKTVAAINSIVDEKKLLDALTEYRRDFLQWLADNKGQGMFLTGWFNRVEALYDLAKKKLAQPVSLASGREAQS